ncbi:MAG: GNAT family N-acetyltransferase [Candidatus Hermodarchaeota archaeon]
MKIRQYESKYKSQLTNLIGQYRIALAELKGSKREIDLKAAEEELEFYRESNYPIYIAEDNKDNLVGFHICKIQEDIVWSEALYVIPEERRKGVASELYEKAEIIAEEKGSSTVYNWVHPNNFRSIPFLKKRGYNVINLIEVCKKRPGEKITQKIKVGQYEFDY